MEPTLYIIMRSDLPDCNPGKGMAAAAHAQAEFNAHIEWVKESLDAFDGADCDRSVAFKNTIADYEEWCGDGNFGRTIVLSADWAVIHDIARYNNVSGSTIDPTYPWKNFYGELQVTKETTCGWCFVAEGIQEDLIRIENLPLHK